MSDVSVWTPANIALIITSTGSLIAIVVPLLVKRIEANARRNENVLQEFQKLINKLIEEVTAEAEAERHNAYFHKAVEEGTMSQSEALSRLRTPVPREPTVLQLRVLGNAHGIRTTDLDHKLSEFWLFESRIPHGEKDERFVENQMYFAIREEVINELAKVWREASEKFGES